MSTAECSGEALRVCCACPHAALPRGRESDQPRSLCSFGLADSVACRSVCIGVVSGRVWLRLEARKRLFLKFALGLIGNAVRCFDEEGVGELVMGGVGECCVEEGIEWG